MIFRRLQMMMGGILALMALVFVLSFGDTHTAHANGVRVRGIIEQVDGTRIAFGGLIVDVSAVDDDDDDIRLMVGQWVEGDIRQINGVWTMVRLNSINGVAVSGNQSNNTSNNSSNNSSNNTSNNTSNNSSDDDRRPRLVVEGPIQAVTGNVITIHNINIVINSVQSTQVNLQVGSFVRVEGRWCDDDDDDDDCDDDRTSGARIQVIANIVVNVVTVDTRPNTGGNAPVNQGGSNPGRRGGSNDDDDDDDDDD